eukprot:6363500-Prymnesium_polylepis.1
MRSRSSCWARRRSSSMSCARRPRGRRRRRTCDVAAREEELSGFSRVRTGRCGGRAACKEACSAAGRRCSTMNN